MVSQSLVDSTLFILSIAVANVLRPCNTKLDLLLSSSQARSIGNTPLLYLSSLSSLLSRGRKVDIFVKDEGANPSGSSKDRVALSILRGKLEAGATSIAEGTSGSTGVALATLCEAIDLPCHIFMPSDQSSAKMIAIEQRGAVCTVVPPSAISNPNNYVNLARRLPGFCDQFDNVDNYRAHFTTTAPEILAAGVLPDAFVMSAGTGGTIAGAGNFLKKSTGCDVVLADCEGSVLHSLATTGVAYTKEQGERVLKRSREDTICEGIGLDRVTKNFEKANIDKSYKITDQEVVHMSRFILKHEGWVCGSSTACNLVAAIRTVLDRDGDVTVVSIKCSQGERERERLGNREFVEARGLLWKGEEEWMNGLISSSTKVI